jgi:hypothetical protein
MLKVAASAERLTRTSENRRASFAIGVEFLREAGQRKEHGTSLDCVPAAD